MIDYATFLARKSLVSPETGFEIDRKLLNKKLFDFQKDLVTWSLRRGRAALFSDCGTGKGPMALEWARLVQRHSGGRVLVLAPLAVAQQLEREGKKFKVPTKYARDGDSTTAEIVVTNYEMLHKFNVSDFAGVVIDESSILKAFDGKTRTTIIEAFRETPYRLACTATPAPNDFMELGNHSEFLGVMTRAEMLATFFVHDGGETQKWRLKGHAEDEFWRWVCSWAAVVKKPSDLGYDDGDFVLPPLEMHEHVVPVDHADARKAGMLFAMDARTLNDQRATKRASIDKRVAQCAALVNDSNDPWIVWCELNDESDALAAAIPDAVEIRGSMDNDEKVAAILGFIDGSHRVIVGKASMIGFGMNLQHCAHQVFAGVSNSYEQTYQAIRRSWRFGQTRTVHVHVVRAETEGAIVANLRRKEADAVVMADAMAGHMREIMRANITRAGREWTEYNPTARIEIPTWLATETA